MEISILDQIIDKQKIEEAANLDAVEIINALFDELSKREKDIVMRRYGLYGDGKETLEKIGSIHNLTRERIRQIENDGFSKIKKRDKEFASLNIKKLKGEEPAWKISQFDSHYIQEALKDKNFINLSAKENNNNKKQLIKILEASTLIQKVFPSSANYILVKLNTLSAKAFQEHLLPFKIMIRDCSNFDGLDDRFVRIAVKDVKSINALKKGL